MRSTGRGCELEAEQISVKRDVTTADVSVASRTVRTFRQAGRGMKVWRRLKLRAVVVAERRRRGVRVVVKIGKCILGSSQR
jgi:hypothetical protein